MSPALASSRSIPDLAIKINGEPLPQRALRDLLEVSVQEHVQGPSVFTLQLSALDNERLDFGLLDSALFNIGGEVEIQLGYSGSLTTLMYGDVCGIHFELGEDEAPSYVVRGYDRRYRMQRGTKTRTFVKMKDSDIAAQIAQEYRLSANVVDSHTQHEYVGQDRRSDLDFLTRRGALIGYEVMISGKTLHFRPRPHARKPVVAIGAEKELLDFSVQLSAAEQVTEVVVRGWDPLRKEQIVGRASKRDESSMGSHGGPEVSHKAFGDAILTLGDQPVAQKEEADQLALERLEQLALGFIQAEGLSQGRTDLRAGETVELKEVGQRFSGPYYVTSATHTFAPQRGYTTSFSARRNAT